MSVRVAPPRVQVQRRGVELDAELDVSVELARVQELPGLSIQ